MVAVVLTIQAGFYSLSLLALLVHFLHFRCCSILDFPAFFSILFRYFILFGDMEVVLYDDRPDSSTRGLVSKVVMSELRRGLLNIPAGIWHADRNLGQKDAVMVNFPTQPYDHESPDKYRLPLENDYIPYRFEDPRGG